MSGKKVNKQTFFVEDWLSGPVLKDWVQKDKNIANANNCDYYYFY